MEEIETARLRLRPLTPGDLDDLISLYSDPEVMRGSSGRPVPRTREETADWMARALAIPPGPGWGVYRVEGRLSGSFLGRCGLRPDDTGSETELAYAFVTAAWGKGIATEAAGTVIQLGFDQGVPRIIADVLAGNRASQRVVEKLGMSRVGEQPSADGLYYRYAKENGQTTRAGAEQLRAR